VTVPGLLLSLAVLVSVASMALPATARLLAAPAGRRLGWIAQLATRRDQRRVIAALPDALRRLAAELGAGRTLERALRSTAAATAPPLGDALAAVSRDVSAGEAVDIALERALPPDDACALLAAAMALQRRLGGDLPRLCRELARTLDDRLRVESDVRSLTAQARFSAAAVPLLPPLGLVGLSALEPDGVGRLLTTPIGLVVLGLAGALNLAGAVAIRRLVRGIA
jgi:tight adherence protein B